MAIQFKIGKVPVRSRGGTRGRMISKLVKRTGRRAIQGQEMAMFGSSEGRLSMGNWKIDADRMG